MWAPRELRELRSLFFRPDLWRDACLRCVQPVRTSGKMECPPGNRAPGLRAPWACRRAVSCTKGCQCQCQCQCQTHHQSAITALMHDHQRWQLAGRRLSIDNDCMLRPQHDSPSKRRCTAITVSQNALARLASSVDAMACAVMLDLQSTLTFSQFPVIMAQHFDDIVSGLRLPSISELAGTPAIRRSKCRHARILICQLTIICCRRRRPQCRRPRHDTAGPGLCGRGNICVPADAARTSLDERAASCCSAKCLSSASAAASLGQPAGRGLSHSLTCTGGVGAVQLTRTQPQQRALFGAGTSSSRPLQELFGQCTQVCARVQRRASARGGRKRGRGRLSAQQAQARRLELGRAAQRRYRQRQKV